MRWAKLRTGRWSIARPALLSHKPRPPDDSWKTEIITLGKRAGELISKVTAELANRFERSPIASPRRAAKERPQQRR